ncbi:MAG: hypothetical protein FK733_19245 [Asgard group archaeon]|nr:hypothetical protein [Asgard group archaeon]
MNNLSTEYKGYLLLGNDGDNIESIINNGLLRAKKYVWITGAKTNDFRLLNPKTKEAVAISQHLVRLARRGVNIKFILAPREQTKKYEKTKTVYEKLSTVEGIEFNFCYDMHMKVIIVDGTWMYFGSANFTSAGLGTRSRKGRNNFEIGTITIDQDAINAIEYQLQQIWDSNECKGCYQKSKGYCKGII